MLKSRNLLLISLKKTVNCKSVDTLNWCYQLKLLLMFLPEQIRNCMVENDVLQTSYLQTTSSGQVDWFCPPYLLRKKLAKTMTIFNKFSLWLTVKHRKINNVKHQLQEKTFFDCEMLSSSSTSTTFMIHNSKSCVITEKRRTISFLLFYVACFSVVLLKVANLHFILNRKKTFNNNKLFKSHPQMNADWPINGF